jgi:hypothetical protein
MDADGWLDSDGWLYDVRVIDCRAPRLEIPFGVRNLQATDSTRPRRRHPSTQVGTRSAVLALKPKARKF